jgi:DNA-binding NarL/FixJ family response regulator
MLSIRVLVVSCSPVFLHAASQSLCRYDNIVEVLAGQSVHEAVKLLKQGPVEVVFLDSQLRDTNVANAVRTLKASQPTSRIVLMTLVDPALYRSAMARLGIDAVINKHKFTAEVRRYFASIGKESSDAENIPRWL